MAGIDGRSVARCGICGSHLRRVGFHSWRDRRECHGAAPALFASALIGFRATIPDEQLG